MSLREVPFTVEVRDLPHRPGWEGSRGDVGQSQSETAIDLEHGTWNPAAHRQVIMPCQGSEWYLKLTHLPTVFPKKGKNSVVFFWQDDVRFNFNPPIQ